MLQDLSSHIVMTESLEKLSGRWQVSYVPLSGKRTSPVQLVAQCCPTLRPHGLQHARLACPSPTPRACSNSCQLSRWCHPNISSSVIPFSCLQCFTALGSFPMSQFFTSGGQSCSFSINPSNEYSGLISFKIDCFHLLSVQGTLKSLLQHHSSKASILWCSAFLVVQLLHPYMTTRKTIALTRGTFVGKVMSLLFNMLSRKLFFQGASVF